MDTIIKWDYMEVLDTEEKIRALCHKGWEPVGVDSRNGIRILKRPCGEIAITKHPELWQATNQNSGIEY